MFSRLSSRLIHLWKITKRSLLIYLIFIVLISILLIIFGVSRSLHSEYPEESRRSSEIPEKSTSESTESINYDRKLSFYKLDQESYSNPEKFLEFPYSSEDGSYTDIKYDSEKNLLYFVQGTTVFVHQITNDIRILPDSLREVYSLPADYGQITNYQFVGENKLYLTTKNFKTNIERIIVVDLDSNKYEQLYGNEVHLYTALTYLFGDEQDMIVEEAGGDGCGGSGVIFRLTGNERTNIISLGSGCVEVTNLLGRYEDLLVLMTPIEGTYENPILQFSEVYLLNPFTLEKVSVANIGRTGKILNAMIDADEDRIIIQSRNGLYIYNIKSKVLDNYDYADYGSIPFEAIGNDIYYISSGSTITKYNTDTDKFLSISYSQNTHYLNNYLGISSDNEFIFYNLE